jgi:hypothetical protein
MFRFPIAFMWPSHILLKSAHGPRSEGKRMSQQPHSSSQENRRWCLEQAIEIVKSAPADLLPTHDRLKRVYKRLLDLTMPVDEESNGEKSPS